MSAAKLTFVVFSKDRPAQLDLLLRSIRRFVLGDPHVAVVYTAAGSVTEDGYATVRAQHAWAEWVDERSAGGFRSATLGVAASAGDRLSFLVDDMIFTHELDPAGAPLQALDADPDVMCCSLRLDPGKTYCYAIDADMTPPALGEAGRFAWRGGEGDWGYPMSTDGHVFRARELRPLLERLEFHNPNALEAALAAAPMAHPLMTCFDVARVINVPDNLVQDTAPNRHAGNSADLLADAFAAGRRLDLSPFVGLRCRQVHLPMDLTFEDGEPSSSEPAGEALASRRFAVAALADELTERPSLLQSFAGSFSDADDVTLVVYGECSGQELSAGLAPVLVATGAAAPDGPDVLGIPGGAPQALAVATRADALLTARRPVAPFDHLPCFDEAALPDLRAQLLGETGAGPAGASPSSLPAEVWAASRIADRRPARHVDVGEHPHLAGLLSAICRVTVVAARPPAIDVDDVEWAQGTAGDLPFADRSLESVASLDAADPFAGDTAAAELERVVAPGGQLLVATEARTTPAALAVVQGLFSELQLVEFAGVDLRGALRRHRTTADGDGFALDVFHFVRPLQAPTARPASGVPATVPRPRRDDAPVEPGWLRMDNAGVPFDVPPDLTFAYAGGQYDEGFTTAWVDRELSARTPAVLYDVGGNIGWFATRAAATGATVRAFEPVAGTADVLERNLARAGADDASVVRAALGERRGSARIHVYSSCGNNSLFERTLPAGHPLRHVGMQDIDVLRLDDLVAAGEPVPTVIKMDVEGAELLVIRGARETLARHRPALLMEWAVTTSDDAGYPRWEVVEELRALGYEPQALTPDGRLIRPEDADLTVETLVAAGR